MSIKQVNYYGLNHEAVNKQFEGELTYCNTFCVKDEYAPVAVYKAKKPNTAKGHKKYMLLQVSRGGGGVVRGMSAKEMKEWRYQAALHCLTCDMIIYSVNRHHMCCCDCNADSDTSITIDGGKDYTKVSYASKALFKHVTLDLIANKVVPDFATKFKKIVNGK